jgi:hypothetical protein
VSSCTRFRRPSCPLGSFSVLLVPRMRDTSVTRLPPRRSSASPYSRASADVTDLGNTPIAAAPDSVCRERRGDSIRLTAVYRHRHPIVLTLAGRFTRSSLANSPAVVGVFGVGNPLPDAIFAARRPDPRPLRAAFEPRPPLHRWRPSRCNPEMRVSSRIAWSDLAPDDAQLIAYPGLRCGRLPSSVNGRVGPVA